MTRKELCEKAKAQAESMVPLNRTGDLSELCREFYVLGAEWAYFQFAALRKELEQLQQTITEDCVSRTSHTKFAEELQRDLVDLFATERLALQNDLEAAKHEIAELKKCPNEVWECAKEIRTLTLERDTLQTENTAIRTTWKSVGDWISLAHLEKSNSEHPLVKLQQVLLAHRRPT